MTVLATDPRFGFFRFLHHETPVEWSDNVDERLDYIKNHKPKKEIKLRLETICYISPLQEPELYKVYKAYIEALKAYTEACKVYEKECKACAVSTIPLPQGVTWDGHQLIFREE